MSYRSSIRILLILSIAVISTAAALAAAAGTEAVEIEGIWQGTLEVQTLKVRVVFHISRDEEGGLTAKLDSPDQGVTGIPVDTVTLTGDSLYINIAMAGIVYTGIYNEAEDIFEGAWNQSLQSFPLSIGRIDEVEKLKRPQEPQKPYPYREEEVDYPNSDAGITLAGTLTIPAGEGTYPAVVLITGSGQQNRDEEIMGHRPFMVLADHLARNGIAVLRFDDRGMGGSGGVHSAATSEDFAGDVLAGVKYLLSRPEIDRSRIGLIGHSEGGMIAPMAAGMSDDIGYIVMMAGPGLNGADILLLQTELIYEASGMDRELLDKIVEHKKLEHDILAAEKDVDRARERLIAESGAFLERYTEEEKTSLGLSEEVIEQRADVYLRPWFRYFMSFDPAAVLRKVTVPVLALAGSLDLQVPAKENLAAIGGALGEAGNGDFTVKELPGLNHLFQHCERGTPDEYMKIEETISPEVLDLISGWILERTSD